MSYIGAEPDGMGKAQRFTYTATGTGTAVTADDDGIPIGYTAGQVSVYLNGVKQVIGTGKDVTATDGSTITFASAYAADDVIEVVALSIFSATTVEGTALISTGETGTKKFLRVDGDGTSSWAVPEGADINSTGETGTSKFLRIDGDGTSSWQTITEYNDDVIQTNIALLAFKTAVNGSLAKYNLQDQVIDEYTDATGVDASASTNEVLTAGAYGTATVSAATGGTITYYGAYAIHTFSQAQSGTNFTAPSGGVTCDILTIAGGGAGGSMGYAGSNGGGGGGAGGFVYYDQTVVTAGAKTVTVGAGGAAGVNTGVNGANSSFASLTAAVGGGRGGGVDSTDAQAGATGGSGGGGGHDNAAGASGTENQGNDGSNSSYSGAGSHAGAGGGASQDGQSAGVGGAGYTEGATVYDWEAGSGTVTFPAAFKVGSGGNLIYAGGGGGGAYIGTGGAGGIGGGGSGTTNSTGGDGTDGLGGGGAGASYSGAPDKAGGSGGDGIVIIRHTMLSPVDLALQSTDTEAEAQPTKADMVMLVEDAGSGVGTVNTHIKGHISRDSGTTFTEGVLVDEGDWGTDKRILAFHDLDISSQPADQTMCYKITTHSASAVYDTKIHATSIGWR